MDISLAGVGLLIGGAGLILLRRLLTTVNSASQKVLRREGYSPTERKVSDWYLIAFGITMIIIGLLDLFGVINV
jgi:hypothetical protein